MLSHLIPLIHSDVQQINCIAIEAGQKILKVYESDQVVVECKSDQSPLTLADRVSHDSIVEDLKRLTPHIPVISEESDAVSYEQRKEWTTYWLIDPLDGTKEFIKRNGEFTVNIALIHLCKPVLGVVYAPVFETLYYAVDGQGAFKQKMNEDAQQIHVQVSDKDCLRVVASRSHASPLLTDYLEALGKPFDCVSVGSSLKFCLVAEGLADLYPRFIPTNEWDTAAAQCVASEAGAKVQDLNGQELVYNKECMLNPFFIVSALC